MTYFIIGLITGLYLEYRFQLIKKIIEIVKKYFNKN
jgi:hypothetical protein